MGIGSRHGDGAGLDRLAQRLQRPAVELRQLVEEQHAEVGEGDLTGLGLGPAADQRGQARRVVRVAVGTAGDQPVFGEGPGQRMHHGHRQRFFGGHRRQQPGQSGRQHGLPGPRRADQQQVVAPRSGDLQRPLGGLLPLDVAQVQRRLLLGRVGAADLGARDLLPPHEMVHQRQQRLRRDDVQPGTGPGGFLSLCMGADQAQPEPVGVDGSRQGADDRADRSVQTQLPHRQQAIEAVRRQHLHFDQQPEHDRQVEVRAFLGQIRRGEVDADMGRGLHQPQRCQRPAHPLLAFADSAFGQTDDGDLGQPAGHQHLHVDGLDVEALEGNGFDLRDHGHALTPFTCASDD